MKKILAVVGATGAQGGGLVQAILDDRSGRFAARAITRKPDSDKGRALAAAGAEVVSADLDDATSLRAAFAGAHGAFCLTNFWEHLSVDKELAQAKNMALAAKQAGVAHVIWSTLEDTRKLCPLDDDRMPTLHGKYKVPHFDGKGEADALFQDAGVPLTLLLTSFYWDNFIYFGMGPRKNDDGSYTLALPMADKPLPGIAAEDIGRCAFGIFQRGDALIGKTVGIAGEILTGAEMAAAFAKALGKKVGYYPMPHAQFAKLGFPGADDLANMFQYKTDFNDSFCAARDVKLSRDLNPGLLDFAAWLEKYKARIPI